VSDDLPVHIRPLAGDLRRRAVTLPRSTGNPARPPRQIAVEWHDGHLAIAGTSRVDGRLTITPSVRGWQLTAQLSADRLPSPGPLTQFATEVFRASDDYLGTDFGTLIGSPLLATVAPGRT
jgi:hypothetical protein